MALKQKIVIETSGRRIRGGADIAIENVHVGLALACELQEAGIPLTPTTIAEMAVRIEYDPKQLYNLARAQVEIKDRPQDIVSWRTVAAAAAQRGGREALPDNLTLEQLHEFRSEVNERINKAEKRIASESDDLGAF